MAVSPAGTLSETRMAVTINASAAVYSTQSSAKRSSRCKTAKTLTTVIQRARPGGVKRSVVFSCGRMGRVAGEKSCRKSGTSMFANFTLRLASIKKDKHKLAQRRSDPVFTAQRVPRARGREMQAVAGVRQYFAHFVATGVFQAMAKLSACDTRRRAFLTRLQVVLHVDLVALQSAEGLYRISEASRVH